LLSISGGKRRAAVVLTAAGLAAIAAFWYFDIRKPAIPSRPLRIGFENVPPVQIRTDHGPAGIAVETINEAAKRAGMTLQWVETGTSSDEAFRRGLVDLWPIMADLPDRHQTVHISKPWLHTNHTLVLRQDATPPDRGFAGRMALFKMPLHVRLARQEFPEAHLVPFAEAREIIKEVCSGAVGAGFMEFRLALSAIENKPAECNSTTLRVVPLSDARLQLGVGSTFEAAGAADRIRDKIGDMYRDGTLAATMAKYSYYGLESEWATYDLMEAAERARWVAWSLSGLGIALVVTLLQLASLRQRKRSEAALRSSEERFRAIFHQAAVGAAQVTLEGAVSIVNDRYCEVLGYPREELLRRRLVDTTHSDDCAEALANRRLLLQGETASYSMEMRSVRKDGSIIWVKLHESLVRDGSGQPTCSIALVDNITERRQTEAALQESEKRFRNMADTAPAMIWVAGPDKLCNFFNQGWLTFTGSALEEALGNGWSAKVHPDDRDPCRTAYSAAFDARRSYQKECRLQRADGEYRWVLTIGVPRFESNGAFAGFVGSCTDITEVKRSQEEALARQKLEGLGVLAGGIAHDFNNLLGGILATSELVLSELPVDSPAYGGVESIKKVADRAAEIVRQMMAYAGQESTEFEPLDLSELVKEMLQLLKISISKRAFLRVDLPENLPAIRANSAQIRRVVMNLILNASEALGEEEGVVSVALEHVRSAPGPFADLEPAPVRNDYVRLTVGDTGSGMTEEIRARIFDPFFTTKFTGRGMGLAAVQGIVRDHGGTINVVSVPGHGSRFEVMLPCTVQPARTIRHTALPASSAAGGSVNGTVLVVEDEEELRMAVSKMLRRRDFCVVEAPDGRAGVDLFRANQREFDAVLLDLTLPGMTGREVLEELRRLRPDLNVIITTAYSHDTALKALGGQQSWFYIRKPYRAVEIEDLLRSVCLRERPSGHAAG
jgi:two-component system, cell cycle sensor histidine kinase and response regulator CckA